MHHLGSWSLDDQSRKRNGHLRSASIYLGSRAGSGIPGGKSGMISGKRKKADQDGIIANIMEDKGVTKEYRKNWARLIQKIYEVDPLICPKCRGPMKIIAFIEDEEITRLPSLYILVNIRKPGKRGTGINLIAKG